MSNEQFGIGELVVFLAGAREGQVGVVSRPISEDSPGHVLALEEDGLVGRPAGDTEVRPATDADEGFTQLVYNLNTLSSKVIEQKLLVYGPEK